jgi:polyribonucleotide nucleotidyltransferase
MSTQGKVVLQKEIAGRQWTFETGELAKQAGGAVLVRCGDAAVLAVATCSSKPREGVDFFPLTVDYEERLYAGGKIPGGFFKREGRPPEKCILTSRLIDRPLRPLFPEGFRNDVQIVTTVLSADQVVETDILALVAASAALAVSDIPFPSPVGAVRIGMNGEGALIVNPTLVENQESKLNLVVAGTREAIVMVEAGAVVVSEAEMLEALKLGHDVIREVISAVEELASRAARPKRELPVYEPDRDLDALIREHFAKHIASCMRIIDKAERERAFEAVSRDAFLEILMKYEGAARERMLSLMTDGKGRDFDAIVKAIKEEELRKMIVDEGQRPDGRKFGEIRPIDCQVGVLPRVHGSGLFTRGQTQVITSVTLGTLSEGQIIDGLGLEDIKRYMHQYNFPPYSVGEVKPMRSPGRREIGHGALAERALLPMIPNEDEFPYAFRLVSEVLESNGSSSMASVCASTLALMDAGIPIKEPVAGVAMGLISRGKSFSILTDIQGMEDFLGDMDFKVAGTASGITALQMDIKLTGITMEIIEKALQQAREARLFILDRIKECIAEPRPSLSPYAPRIFVIMISPDRIKDVIGPGGKMINKIIAETGVKIDVEPDGKVFVAAVDLAAGEMALKMIENLTRDVEVGEVYQGKVMRLMNFGAFMEILPGKEGLLHISQISPERVERIEDAVAIGDEFPVKVHEIDSQGRINLTRRGLVKGFDENSREERPNQTHREGGFNGPRRSSSSSGGRSGSRSSGTSRRSRN